MFNLILIRVLGFSFVFVIITAFFPAIAAPITKQLPISTSIDKNKFYSNSFTKVEFSPNTLKAVYSNEKDTFRPLQTSLFIESDISDNQANNSYQIILTDNQSQCYTAGDRILDLSDNFVDIEIDGKILTQKSSVKVDDFKSSKDDFKHSTHDFKLLFSPLPEVTQVDDYLLRCSGSISVRLEFTI